MTKIKNYPIDLNITANDKWIGTDSADNNTKNFTPNGLASYFNDNEVVNVVGSVRFFYDTVEPLDDRKQGSFSFPSEVGSNVSYESITNLVFSKNSKGGNNVVDYMSSMIGNIMLIHKSDNVNKYAIYRMISFEQDIVDIDFFNCSLEYIDGNGGIEEDKDYSLSLLQISSVDNDKNYVFTQTLASSSWNVNHNLNKFPSVSIVDSSNNLVIGDVMYIDSNNLTISFNASFSGKAYIN